MVDTFFADKIALMLEDIIRFLMNLAPGWWLFLAVCFVGALIYIFFDNFKAFLMKPQY